jgi:3-mercaptopyruvate sulfurtransferase SseA
MRERFAEAISQAQRMCRGLEQLIQRTARFFLLQDAVADPKEPVIVYCRIGERSSHTWFVLKYLLGLPDVKNYDGSWTEWGNSVGLPIER